MGLIWTRQQRTRQPQSVVRASPGVAFALLPLSGWCVAETVSGKKYVGSGVAGVCAAGRSVSMLTASSYAASILLPTAAFGTGDFAVGVTGTFDSTTTIGVALSNDAAVEALNNQWRLQPNYNGSSTSAGSFCFYTYDGSITVAGANSLFAAGEACTFLGVRRGTTMELWKNGRLVASATGTARNVSGSEPQNIGFGWGSTTTYNAGGHRCLGFGLAGIITPARAAALSANPWQVFADEEVPIWFTDAGAPALQTISPSAIASGEAFGTAVVGRGAVAVAPTGIASGEAFGTAVVGRGAVAVAPSAIASGEAFGTAVVSGGAIVVAPTGIASAEAFGTAVVGRGAVAVAPTAIDSGEAFGTATLRNGSTVSAVAIASAEAFGTAVVTPGGVIVSPPSIDSGQAFGTATVGDGSAAVLAAPRLRPAAAGAARPPRVQSGRRAPNLSASRRSWR